MKDQSIDRALHLAAESLADEVPEALQQPQAAEDLWDLHRKTEASHRTAEAAAGPTTHTTQATAALDLVRRFQVAMLIAGGLAALKTACRSRCAYQTAV